ncbi:hypothetical protein AB0C52_28520 [Streptomyces sp. NPDC048717]|uniref:hypothetical protein n=1 Tax=Streptomyces sp. NPDC048717 TaxID=3154928 RepID=UPI00343D2477
MGAEDTKPGASYKRRGGRRAATALLPLLLTALAACQSGGSEDAGGAHALPHALQGTSTGPAVDIEGVCTCHVELPGRR